jgi:hypothetical protein
MVEGGGGAMNGTVNGLGPQMNVVPHLRCYLRTQAALAEYVDRFGWPVP